MDEQSGSTGGGEQGIRIGWAGGSITPERPVALAGQFHTRITTTVRDPVTATVLALESEDGTCQSVMVSLDGLWASDYVIEGFRREWPGRGVRELAADNVLMSGTHSHTAPTQPGWFTYRDLPDDVMTPEEYGDYLVSRIVDLVAEAWQSRASGAVSWGYGQAVVGHNRRAVYTDGTASMYGNTADPMFSHMEGGSDHGVDFLFTYDPGHALTGMLVNLACPSQCTEGANEVSADYWHETREELRRRFGAALHILPQCGSGGDQSPHRLIYKRAEERMFRLKGLLPAEGGDVNFAQRQAIALRIADAAGDVLPAAGKDIRDRVALARTRVVIEAPLRRLSPSDVGVCHERLALHESQVAALEAKHADPTGAALSSAKGRVAYYRQALERHEQIAQGGVSSLPLELHAARIGDVAFVSNRFEYLLDFGLQIKAKSPALQTCIVQLAGGGTYCATARAERAGGYGAWFASTWVGHEGGQMAAEESLRLIRGLFED